MVVMEMRDSSGGVIGRWTPAESPSEVASVHVDENRPYGITLQGAEPDVEYHIRIGDLDIDELIRSSVSGPGQSYLRFGSDTIRWPEGPYFESGRGHTRIWLGQRRVGGGSWDTLLTGRVYVVPTKLGEKRYDAMVSALQELCAGLISDLIGKSKRSYERALRSRGLSMASKEIELHRIDQMWNALAPLIRIIAVSPIHMSRRTLRAGLYWGDRPLPPAVIAPMVRKGFDRMGTRGPVRATLTYAAETTDIPEHAYILFFLCLIYRRLERCIRAIDSQERLIEDERGYRDIAIGNEPSLYAQHDIPKLKRLAKAKDRARLLSAMVANVARLPLFEEVSPRSGSINRHNFTQNSLYRTAFRLMQDYLRDAGVWIGDSRQTEQATLKLTSRLYEHWVFILLVDRLRGVGIPLEGWDDLLPEMVRSHFSLEFDRGLTLEGRIGGERTLRVTFEPWIVGKDEAQNTGRSVYKEGGKAPWCPDILLEVGVGGRTSYAVVIDCKYSRTLREAAWETQKYLRIRATGSGAQVVRQLWLVHPADSPGIRPLDEAVFFDATGPNRPANETILGTLGVVPDIHGRDEAGVLQSFAKGMVWYFRGMDLHPD